MIEQIHFLLKVEMIENRWELELKFSACFIYSLKVTGVNRAHRAVSFFISFSLSHLEEIIPKNQYLFKCWISFKLIIMRGQAQFSFTAYIWVWPFVINRSSSIKIINSVMTPP